MAKETVPQHIAIIMDGNGRWAKDRDLPRIEGHRAGAKTVDIITETARECGVKFLTLYAFSTENWKRPTGEVSELFRLLEEYLDTKEEKLNKNNIRLAAIGRIEKLPKSTQDKLSAIMSSTMKNDGMTLSLALNYGARTEIIDAVRAVSEAVRSGRMRQDQINEKTFSEFLYTKGIPDPDLLIRTSGEFRISNFLLWQISYSELYITKKLWPDFNKEDFKDAIAEYQRRERRFGG